MGFFSKRREEKEREAYEKERIARVEEQKAYVAEWEAKKAAEEKKWREENNVVDFYSRPRMLSVDEARKDLEMLYALETFRYNYCCLLSYVFKYRDFTWSFYYDLHWHAGEISNMDGKLTRLIEKFTAQDHNQKLNAAYVLLMEDTLFRDQDTFKATMGDLGKLFKFDQIKGSSIKPIEDFLGFQYRPILLRDDYGNIIRDPETDLEKMLQKNHIEEMNQYIDQQVIPYMLYYENKYNQIDWSLDKCIYYKNYLIRMLERGGVYNLGVCYPTINKIEEPFLKNIKELNIYNYNAYINKAGTGGSGIYDPFHFWKDFKNMQLTLLHGGINNDVINIKSTVDCLIQLLNCAKPGQRQLVNFIWSDQDEKFIKFLKKDMGKKDALDKRGKEYNDSIYTEIYIRVMEDENKDDSIYPSNKVIVLLAKDKSDGEIYRIRRFNKANLEEEVTAFVKDIILRNFNYLERQYINIIPECKEREGELKLFYDNCKYVDKWDVEKGCVKEEYNEIGIPKELELQLGFGKLEDYSYNNLSKIWDKDMEDEDLEY